MSADLHLAVGERLRTAGRRYTPKRRVLVEALRRRARPTETAELVRAARLPLSSVYRNLAVLEEAGAVRRVLAEDGLARFELAEDLTAHHHHLVCRTCGAVEDVRVPERLERSIDRVLAEAAERAGFSGATHRLDLVGTCRRCRVPTA